MRVRFEPIGETIDCGREETVLEAAFRHGYNLAHGCREGQCSACKCFLLEGEVALKRYSTFALSDSELAGGYSLMCRAMPERDLVVELLHYDPAGYRLEHAIEEGTAVVEVVEALTDDVWRLELDAPGFEFTPGQYIDVHVEDGRRSFSIANADPGRIELIVKRYPSGRFSGKLERLAPGTEIAFTGPYGTLRVHEGTGPIVMLAGGSGIAPIMSLLRQLAADGASRPVRLFFAARPLFWVEDLRSLCLPDFRLVPAAGRGVLELLEQCFASGELEASACHVYMCGPPALLEAGEATLARLGVEERRIFQDRFTAAAEAAPELTPAVDARADSEREFSWFEPSKRRATVYEDVTVDTQPSVQRHLTRGWPLSFEDGRGTWDEGSTELRSSDWYLFRDPGEQWERPFYQFEASLERQVESAVRSAGAEGLLQDFSPAWVEFLRRFLQVPAFVEHGLWFALATAGRACLSDSVATCVCFQAAMKQRSAQALVLYAMDLEPQLGPLPIAAARDAWLNDEYWQGARRLLERLWATRDWGEVIVASNLCIEPLLGTLLRRELGIRAAAANGDTVTPTLARVATEEWEWTRGWTAELVRFLLDDARFGGSNRATISRWVDDWLAQASDAAAGIAPLASAAGIDGERALSAARRYADEVVSAALERPASQVDPGPRRRARPLAPRSTQSEPFGDPGFDFVGIVMAKSAEGDAVAEILGRRGDVMIQEQPALWDIRARGRLVVSYEEISAQLGYEIDAYSIQHEMSTHYGRLIATDDALMLFSDPAEAMEHLMA